MGGRTSRALYEADLNSGKKDLFDITSGREVLVALLIIGGTLTALHFAPWALAAAMPLAKTWKDSPRNRQRFSNTFAYMKKRGYIDVEELRGKINIRLTAKGKVQAEKGYARIVAIRPVTESAWDKKWRLILFDVPASESAKRNAFRSLIRRLGAIMLQKSVWLYPYDCSGQVQLLKEFFELDDDQVRLVIVDALGGDKQFRKHFKLN